MELTNQYLEEKFNHISTLISSKNELINTRLDDINNRLDSIECEKKNKFLTTSQKEIIKYIVIIILSFSVSYFSIQIDPSKIEETVQKIETPIQP